MEQTCKNCGAQDAFNFHVSDSVGGEGRAKSLIRPKGKFFVWHALIGSLRIVGLIIAETSAFYISLDAKAPRRVLQEISY